MGSTLDQYVQGVGFGKIPTKSLYEKSSEHRNSIILNANEMNLRVKDKRKEGVINVDEFFVELTTGDSEMRQVFLNFVMIVS